MKKIVTIILVTLVGVVIYVAINAIGYYSTHGKIDTVSLIKEMPWVGFLIATIVLGSYEIFKNVKK